jgi:hypothetical protein
MLRAWFGAKLGASSITTRPFGKSMYRVFSRSSGRQSAALASLTISPTLGFGGSGFGCVAPRLPAARARTIPACTANVAAFISAPRLIINVR